AGAGRGPPPSRSAEPPPVPASPLPSIRPRYGADTDTESFPWNVLSRDGRLTRVDEEPQQRADHIERGGQPEHRLKRAEYLRKGRRSHGSQHTRQARRQVYPARRGAAEFAAQIRAGRPDGGQCEIVRAGGEGEAGYGELRRSCVDSGAESGCAEEK